MSRTGENEYRHVRCLVASLHAPKNVHRPPWSGEIHSDRDDGGASVPSEQSGQNLLCLPPLREDTVPVSSSSGGSEASFDTDDPTRPQVLNSTRRNKSNSICLGTASPSLTVDAGRKRRGMSFLHLAIPVGFPGVPMTEPHFAPIPTLTVTPAAGGSEHHTRRFSQAFAFALRRHSNTSLHRSESMVSLACFRTLINFISDDNVDGIQSYLSSNKNALVDDKDENGTTALMFACEKGSSAIVSTLLSNGADPRVQDADGWGPLALASKRGALDIVNDLLNHGADISHRDMGGWTPFMWACYKGHEAIVDALAAAGADPNAAGAFGVTALMWAAGRSHAAAAERALAAGARANAADRHGTTALVWAARAGCVPSVRALLKQGAVSVIDAPGMYSWTPLLQATMGNHLEIVQILLEHKPNLNALDKDGCTALTLACKEGYYDIAVALITAGAYINIQDRDGDTCLIHATKGGHKSIVEALLKKYADVDALGKDRKTAIYTAIEKGHTKIVKLLLQANPDLELATKDGDTALLRAVRTRNAEMVQMLIDKKARIQASDKRGDTALHIAMRARSKAIVEILLRNPKNSQLLYRPNRQQETPYNIDLTYPKTILGQIFGARKLNTNEDNENMLGYGLYSSALADMLSEPTLSVPITVGLYARWGSGKSFLLNKLKEEMKNFAHQWSWEESGWADGGGGKGMAGGWAAWWAGAHAALATAALATAAAGVWWSNALAIATGLLLLLTLVGLLLKFAANKYDWYWSQTLMMKLNHKFDSLKLVLQVMFCHPPGPQSSPTLPAQPIRFHFTDQAKGSTQEGEASVIQMIVSLSEALESQYGKLCTRLYRAFRPKPVAAAANWRWRRVCCVPHILAFELCYVCATIGLCAVILNNVDERNKLIHQSILIVVGALISLIAVANIYTWGRMASAIFLSPRAHLKRSIKKQPEGFLQALRPEILLLTDMVKCLDAFTGQQTRLVVVVDALDSCEQDRVLVVLNAIHSLCSEALSPFIVLLAIDPHIISKAVEVNSRRAFSESNIGGWDYLRNMVQLPFYLQNSTLRRVDIARHAASKRMQVYSEDFALQRSVSVRRLSTASEIMSSQERIKPTTIVSSVVGGGASQSQTRRLRPSESIASSIASGLHRLTGIGGGAGANAGASLTAMPAPTAGDLSRVLLTDDYFSDVNPRSMRRLMNVIYITGRLLKAFKIEFNYYSLASWINLTEQWPFRASWIIFHHETYEEHIDDNTPLKQIYEKVKPNIPTLRDAEPLMDLDRDERKLDIFLGVHRTSLLAADLKIFLPFTINLDPYIKKVIKDEHQQQQNMEGDLAPMPFANALSTKGLNSTSKLYQLNQKKQKVSAAPLNQNAAWMNWMGAPPQFQQGIMQQPPQFPQFHPAYPQQNTVLSLQTGATFTAKDICLKESFTGLKDFSDVRLSNLSVNGVCNVVDRALGDTRSTSIAPALHQQNICGRVLMHCDMGELKQALGLNFGDWEMLKMLILTLRDMEATMPNPPPAIGSTDRGMETEKEPKQRPILESQRSKPSNMEKQVTLEEQMICGALQTLNEEAMEDVLQGDSSVPDEVGELQLMLLAPSSSAAWQTVSPPGSLCSSPHLPRKFEPPILKTSASFKSQIKKHVYINENGSNFDSQTNLRNAEIPGITFRYEDDVDVQCEPITMKLDKINRSPKSDDQNMLHLSSSNTKLINIELLGLNLNQLKSKNSDNIDNVKDEGHMPLSVEPKSPNRLRKYLSRRSKSFKKPTSMNVENASLSNFSQSAEDTFFRSSTHSGLSTAKSADKISRVKDKIFPSSSYTDVPSRAISDNMYVTESDDESVPLMLSRVSSHTSKQSVTNQDFSINNCNDPHFHHVGSKNINPEDSAIIESSLFRKRKDKCLDVECIDYSFIEVAASNEISPNSDTSLVESLAMNHDYDGKSLPAHNIVDETCESISQETNHLSPQRKVTKNALLYHTDSDDSLSNMLEPYQLDLISPSSDTSLRSALWRQNAIDNQDDWATRESSI